MSFLASGLDKAVVACVGLGAVAFGAPPPGALEASVGLAGVTGYLAGRQRKFGPECARIRKKTREGIRAGFEEMLKIEGDRWSAHNDLANADEALERHLESCVIDRNALAQSIVSPKGFPGEAADMVMAELAEHEPKLFGHEARFSVSYRYARSVVEISLHAAFENRQYYEALEPHIIGELGQAVGKLVVHAERSSERDKVADARQERMAEILERMERRLGEPDLTHAEYLGFARTVLERAVPEDQLKAALSEITKNYFSMRTEIEALKGLTNEAPEIRPYLEAAQAALDRDDMVELDTAETALKEVKRLYDASIENRRTLEDARRQQEDKQRVLEDQRRAQIAETLATASAARLDRRSAAAHYGEAAGLWRQNTRNAMIAFSYQGDLLSVAGDTAGAAVAFEASLEVAARLAQADPSNAERARDLSVSLDRIGDVRRAQSDLPGALDAYQQGMEIRERLAQADPSNAERARDVMVSFAKLAGVDAKNAAAHWAEVVKRLEAMQTSGKLSPADEPLLPIARDELQKALNAKK